MNYLGQRNYPGTMLGNSGYSLARYGCLTVDITMYYNWVFNKNVSPVWVASQLEYDQNGMLLWDSLANIGLKLVSRIRKRDDSTIIAALKDPIEGCMIQVDNDHWLFGLGKITFGGYTVADPWFGDKSTTYRYRNNITGCAIISKI